MELEQDQVRADGRCRSGCKAVQIGEIQERKVERQRLNIFGGGNRKGTGKIQKELSEIRGDSGKFSVTGIRRNGGSETLLQRSERRIEMREQF